MEQTKYVIKNKKTNKYLSPYNYGEHWVNIESAQRYNIETNKEKVSDLVDFIWVEGESVELIKVRVLIQVKEIEKKEVVDSKKDFIFTKKEYVKIKEKISELKNVKYNDSGTKLKPFKMVHHIVYNLIKDNYYLKGLELSQNKFFLTHSNILLAKNIINNDEKLKKELIKVFPIFSEKNIKLIQEKLKKQIED
jgi:hypothetical protein